jgi:outer membrane lipoprotein-sorting protein
MRKIIIAIAGAVILCMGSAYAQDLQKILDKHFKAIGQEKILKVQTLVSTGIIGQMGMEMPFKTITKRPDKAYMEMDFEGTQIIMAFDGVNGWAVQPWTGSSEPVDLVGSELRPIKVLSDLDGSLWNYQEKEHQLELMGTEEMEGTEVYVLKLSKKDGDIIYYYLDSENYVISKMRYNIEVNGQETEMVALMSNFQVVDGYTVPFRTEQKFDGQTGMIITYEQVTFNEEIDDTIFLKPGTAPAEKQ